MQDTAQLISTMTLVHTKKIVVCVYLFLFPILLCSALLRMDKEVKFTNLLKPVCLPTRGKSFSHYDVSVRQKCL